MYDEIMRDDIGEKVKIAIREREFSRDDFYLGHDPLIMAVWYIERSLVPYLNELRFLYLDSKDTRYLDQLLFALPSSYILK